MNFSRSRNGVALWVAGIVNVLFSWRSTTIKRFYSQRFRRHFFLSSQDFATPLSPIIYLHSVLYVFLLTHMTLFLKIISPSDSYCTVRARNRFCMRFLYVYLHTAQCFLTDWRTFAILPDINTRAFSYG